MGVWWRKRIATKRKCVLCHALAAEALCDDCLADMLLLRRCTDEVCPLCAAGAKGGLPCGVCQREKPAQAALWASFVYEPPVSRLIYAYKFLQRNDLAAALVVLMRANPPFWLEEVDAVLAMPLSQKRLHERGFNQSHVLAQALALSLNLPLLSPNVVNRRYSVAQSTLPLAKRRANVRGVFQVASKADVKNRNLLLIDDVTTTGATVTELAQTLMRSGAASVYAWTIAKPK